jgi:hypothetical protein
MGRKICWPSLERRDQLRHDQSCGDEEPDAAERAHT